VQFRIIDARWPASVVSLVFFLVVPGFFLSAILLGMRPFYDRLVSVIVYYALVLFLVGVIAVACAVGFTYRYTTVDQDAITIHTAWYGLKRRAQRILKCQIAAVECCDCVRSVPFGQRSASTLRLKLTDGSDVVLTEVPGGGQLRRENDALTNWLSS
jgi:hypothetical protein